EKEALNEQRALQKEYFQPIVVAAACAGLVIVVSMLGRSDSKIDVASMLIAYSVLVAASVAVGFVALVIAAKLWLGGIDNLPLTAVRLIGVASAQTLARMLSPGLGLILGIVFISIVTACMVRWLFDMDFEDAALVSVIMVAINIALGVAIFAMFMAH
ncbi:MAG TPA: hypothetical protein VG711_01090, partial [Phycisphaerales bacterium]|nr:hypothetical protein [Phycisphaerales bacterium]